MKIEEDKLNIKKYKKLTEKFDDTHSQIRK
jgi:hypothetical protein